MNELLRCSNAAWERQYQSMLEITDPATKSKDNIIYIDKKLPKLRSYNAFPQASIPVVESLVCQQLLMEKFEYVCTDVMNQRTSRNVHVQQAILTLMPRLAAFNRQLFVGTFLDKAMSHLFGTIRNRDKERGSCFVTLGLMALAIENDIDPYLDKIVDFVKAALPRSDNMSRKKSYVDSPIFKCITFLAHALERHEKMDVPNLLEQMLASGLTPSLTICLRELAKKIPPQKEKISVGLLKMLSTILLTKQLVHPGLPGQLKVQYGGLGNISETNDSQMLILALNTLGIFDFKNQNLIQFVQRCANHYTNHESQVSVTFLQFSQTITKCNTSLFDPILHSAGT